MSSNNSDLVKRAKEFATKAHAGQFLKNVSADPFINHPQMVVTLVEASGGSGEELAAAWLHDVVEDTPVTIEEIADEFGEAIRELVDGLTDPPHFVKSPNRIRKRWQAERVREKSASVKRVKIADQTVNTTLMGNDPPIGWNSASRLEYVEGAKLIADECARVSEFLDELFLRAYIKARREIQGD